MRIHLNLNLYGMYYFKLCLQTLLVVLHLLPKFK